MINFDNVFFLRTDEPPKSYCKMYLLNLFWLCLSLPSISCCWIWKRVQTSAKIGFYLESGFGSSNSWSPKGPCSHLCCGTCKGCFYSVGKLASFYRFPHCQANIFSHSFEGRSQRISGKKILRSFSWWFQKLLATGLQWKFHKLTELCNSHIRR